MAFPDLTIPESLRPWHGQGLRLLLIQPAGEAPSTTVAGVASATGPVAGETGQTGESPSSVQPSGMRSQWERLLAQLPATSRCVLTYHDLAFDLAGRPDPARREFMRRLLTGLSQPRGTLSFWPLGLVQADADSDRIHVSVNYFLAGLSKLQPEVVFIFGSRCSLVLGLEHPDYDCVTVDIFGQGPRRYCFLPELQEFIDNPASVATLTSFILAMLAS